MEDQKRPYEPPEVCTLGEVQASTGVRECSSGSGDFGFCVSGSMAGMSCGSGNFPTGACSTGNAD
jgi:hypothetical protein